MSEASETLLALYLEDIAYARHHEILRSHATNIILAAGAVLGATIGFDDSITVADIPAALFLALVGAFGAAFNYKHYERFHSHYARARKYRSALDVETGLNLVSMKEQADKEQRSKFPRSYKWSLKYFWCGMPLCVSLMGIVVIFVIGIGEYIGEIECTNKMK